MKIVTILCIFLGIITIALPLTAEESKPSEYTVTITIKYKDTLQGLADKEKAIRDALKDSKNLSINVDFKESCPDCDCNSNIFFTPTYGGIDIDAGTHP